MIYTYDELLEKTTDELLEIKKTKQDELAEVRSKKLIIIGNILSLQGMIKTESSDIREGGDDDN